MRMKMKQTRIKIKGAMRRRMAQIAQFPFGAVRLPLYVRSTRCPRCLIRGLEEHLQGQNFFLLDGVRTMIPHEGPEIPGMTAHYDHKGRGFIVCTTPDRSVTWFGRLGKFKEGKVSWE